MAGIQNETRRHFQTRQLDEDMAQAYETSVRISPKDHVRALKMQRLGLLVFLGLVIGGFGLAVWLY